MAFAFAHMELHSRKGGKSGSVSYVLDEAARVEGACSHVATPAPPETVWGMSIGELRLSHDAAADAAVTTLASGKQRRIRQDQNTLFSVVVSFPPELVTAEDPAAVPDWEKRAVAWLRREFGDELLSVVRHVDEKAPHLHAYGRGKGPDMRAAVLHPGYQAKAAALAAGDDNKAADRAYRAAMREWQDRYWEQVAGPSGMARLGPGRRRLTRAEWHEEQTASRFVRKALRGRASLEMKADAFIERKKLEADAIVAAAKDRAREVAAASKTMHDGASKTLQEARSVLGKAVLVIRIAESAAGRVNALLTSLRGHLTPRERKEFQASADVVADELENAKKQIREVRQATPRVR